LFLLVVPALATAGDPTLKQLEFFEKKIRPVLTEHCGKCHGAEAVAAKKIKGGLLLDTKAGLLAGGDSGPAVVPGKPADSLLFQTLTYDHDTQMPPKGKLPAAVIADFRQWIQDGAADPRTGAAKARQVGMTVAAGKKFWAYQPIPRQRTTGIDGHIDAAIRKAGLMPAPAADPATLARRLYFDLTGLPPTPEQLAAFQTADYENVVDQLLASPAFGERWGRHWLDVARFGESLTLRGFILPEAWRYRDYVLDAFNADMPFDQFVREQLAGDLLPATDPAARRRQLTATTFLTLGNTNLEDQDKKQLRMDHVDETLDVISKGFLAQTVTCARCHDHKFDPIPTADYYALAGILRNVKAMDHANVSKWVEVPLPMDADAEATYAAHEAQVAAVQLRIKAAKAKGGVAAAKGVLAVKDVPGVVVDDADAKKVGTWQPSTHNGTYIGDGYVHDQDAGKGEKTLTFATELPTGKYEVRLAYAPGGNRADKVPVTVMSADGENDLTVNMTRNPPLDGRYVSLGEYRFEKGGQSFVLVSTTGTKGHVCPDAVVFVPLDPKAVAPKTAGKPPAPKAKGDDLPALEAELKKLQASGPKRPRVMTVVEEPKIEDAKVHIRGLVGNQGATVPRGFLQVATTGPMPKLPANQSGRKELAAWIASADNPLTARVFANRAWHWLLGSGLVRTVDNFGTTGEAPSHPELLDELAAGFVADGWSVKKLVKRIVLSDTYRRASATAPDSPRVAADPENRLFGRANRRRLDAECIRDAILSVSGELDSARGGPTFAAKLTADYGYTHASLRRSVYLPVFRNALPPIFDAFDFADPSLVVGARSASTVAPQALFLLNDPFPISQAKAAAERLLAEKFPTDSARLDFLYRWCLSRLPTAGERAVAARFLAASATPADAWAGLFQAVFASADFRYQE
jgi:cytochrome c553